jgi:hypothetical protein
MAAASDKRKSLRVSGSHVPWKHLAQKGGNLKGHSFDRHNPRNYQVDHSNSLGSQK